MNKIVDLKWNLYLKRRYLLFKYGISKGLVKPYDDALINNLRNYYYGGIPVSIIILYKNICLGYCCDRALLITLGFKDDDFKLVTAQIDALLLNPMYQNRKDKSYSLHKIAIRTKKDGTEWVYDTSLGLVIEKKLYFKMENVKIKRKNNKEETIKYQEYIDILNANIENDKYASHLILPNIEFGISKYNGIYKELLLKEIEIFKEKIYYDEICKEIEEDKKIKIKTNRFN